MRVNTNPKVDYYKIQDTIAELLKVIDILPVTKQDIFDALSLRWKDIEVLKPSDFIEKYISENEVK